MSAAKTKSPSRSAPTQTPSSAISDAELVVMKVVWHHPSVTANQVVAALEEKTDWKLPHHSDPPQPARAQGRGRL